MSVWTLPHAPDVTLLQSKFSFLNLATTKLNGLVIKLKGHVTGRPLLVLINPPKFTPEIRDALQRLEAESEAKVEVILQPGDWHHFQLPDAQALFPDAALYVASERNVRKQPAIGARAKVLDRNATSIPELGDEIRLIPWLGYSQDGMPKVLSGEPRGAPRIEFAVFHVASGTLFVTDHFIFTGQMAGKPLRANTGGFKLVDAEAARESVRRVLAMCPRRVVCSHGDRDACVRDASELPPAYAALLAAHGAGDVVTSGDQLTALDS